VRIEYLTPDSRKIFIEKLIRYLLNKVGATGLPTGKIVEGDVEKALNSKIVVEMDKEGRATGTAWFQSTHREAVI
jgi:hypothetical protein